MKTSMQEKFRSFFFHSEVVISLHSLMTCFIGLFDHVVTIEPVASHPLRINFSRDLGKKVVETEGAQFGKQLY